MTDNEIIKAQELCLSFDDECPDDCPYHSICDEDITLIDRLTLDLINRQKSEIEENNLKIDHQAQIIRTLETALADKMADQN